ncbi:MAG TPA: hypothetical protein VEC12_07345 [Bacteroidia bacterium]|nr:hypothetical protein [Bacteroidia bacterium]
MAQKKPITQTTTAEKPVAGKTAAAAGIFELKNSHLWILTAAAFAGFYYYSTKSTGYYQDDEIAHFMGMMGFWDDPKSIMGNWSKPGYKLLYVLPAKLGYHFVLILNCIVSALGCWLAAKTAQHFSRNAAGLAFLLAALQPVWIEMSFRNYADILSGVLLIATIYLALKEKWLPASLILSYNILVRQEFLILVAIFGIYLLVNRKWIAAFALGVFPLLYCIWTLQAQGDFLYMINEARATSAAYAKEYPRQGIEHYLLRSAVIFGAMQIALLLVALYQIISSSFNRQWLKSPDGKVLFVAIPFVVFFGIHCIFNLKSPEIGPATGGNLRYMTAVSPLVGVLAALALVYLKRPSKTELYVMLGVSGLLVLAYMCYEHEYLHFKVDPKSVAEAKTAEEYESMKEYLKNYYPFVFFIAGALLFFLPLKGLLMLLYVTAAGLIYVNKEVHPYKLSPENQTLQTLVQRINKQPDLKDRKVLSNHSNLWFYWLTETKERKKESGSLDSTSLVAAPVGTLAIWETHYGYRPNRTPGSVKPEYFEQNGYRLIEPMMMVSKDQRFQVAVFEKVK